MACQFAITAAAHLISEFAAFVNDCRVSLTLDGMFTWWHGYLDNFFFAILLPDSNNFNRNQKIDETRSLKIKDTTLQSKFYQNSFCLTKFRALFVFSLTKTLVRHNVCRRKHLLILLISDIWIRDIFLYFCIKLTNFVPGVLFCLSLAETR